jgi:hypothetical protein
LVANAIEIPGDIEEGNKIATTGENKTDQIMHDHSLGRSDDTVTRRDVQKNHENDPVEGETFSTCVQREGPWKTVLSEKEIKEQRLGKQMKVTIDRQKSKDSKGSYNRRKVQYHNGTTLLIGAKPERSMILYLKNIFTEDREDDHMCRDIKSYCRQVGIRIMTTDIVHNRFCEDVVGCRIRVPVSQVDKALSIETWPDEITCRKWEPRNMPPKRLQQQNNDNHGY